MTASTRGKFSALQISPLASLALLTAAGLALRFISIGKWPLWGDEGLTLLIGQWSIMNLFLAPIDPTPGLYYALHKIFLGPMVDAAGARSISLLCGTLLIPAVYFLAKEMRLPALLSAALTALSFPLIDYSQEARPYALLVLLTVLSAFCFVRWNRIGRLSDLLGALLFCLLAFYTHFVSIFWIGPIAAATFALARRKSALPLLLAAILAVPEVTRILRYREGGFAWLLEATPAQAADTLSRAFLPFRPTSPWLAVAAVLLGWRFWVHRSAIAAWVRSNSGAAIVLAVLLIEPLLVWLAGMVAVPIFMTRTILLGVLGFMLLLAFWLQFEELPVRFGIIALYGAGLLFSGTTRHKEEWNSIAGIVGRDTALLCQPWQAAAFLHASESTPRVFLLYDHGLAEVTGRPWPIALFRVHVSGHDLLAAKHVAERVDPRLQPVWAIRSGSIAHLAMKPTTLAEAVRVCRMNKSDHRPSYRAE